MKHFLYILTGFIIFLLIFGVERMGIIIICTLGISLFVIIPVSWAIGFLVLVPLTGGACLNWGKDKKIEIFAFIEKAKERGYVDSDIKKALLSEGWSKEEIEKAFKEKNIK